MQGLGQNLVLLCEQCKNTSKLEFVTQLAPWRSGLVYDLASVKVAWENQFNVLI